MEEVKIQKIMALIDEYAFQVKLMFPEATKILTEIGSILREHQEAPDGWKPLLEEARDAAINSGSYESYRAVQDAFEKLEVFLAGRTWQSIRNESLEEAAVICETAPDYLQNSTFDGVAAYIRSRKTA